MSGPALPPLLAIALPSCRTHPHMRPSPRTPPRMPAAQIYSYRTAAATHGIARKYSRLHARLPARPAPPRAVSTNHQYIPGRPPNPKAPRHPSATLHPSLPAHPPNTPNHPPLRSPPRAHTTRPAKSPHALPAQPQRASPYPRIPGAHSRMTTISSSKHGHTHAPYPRLALQTPWRTRTQPGPPADVDVLAQARLPDERRRCPRLRVKRGSLPSFSFTDTAPNSVRTCPAGDTRDSALIVVPTRGGARWTRRRARRGAARLYVPAVDPGFADKDGDTGYGWMEA
ncbi:hypothetical protein GLOTRDRAFT_133258 [Gloeophyllum trabeum ATCC 11539]|uniref:Uncharacterized protein n=1 Tax=Gloeophyllum trabeum (strain ATCC 11539 / FP-39264 / Madison 617) TaxID=670483 RepID=S7PUA7_GLOTA|nr:uncharacterized protein GLOTRDRAFT_133258 [Gloeophyllum trabeum ATCC 11539]EPQ51396.1 hypothetical protein GLOTRDRAFT_133258 [Gloeophyllum trabeum ATCC 11539]